MQLQVQVIFFEFRNKLFFYYQNNFVMDNNFGQFPHLCSFEGSCIFIISLVVFITYLSKQKILQVLVDHDKTLQNHDTQLGK